MMMKRGDASIIATVLLIVSAIALAIVVTTFSKEQEEQVGKEIVTLGNSVECADVRISVESFDGDRLVTLRSRGTLGIGKAVARIYSNKVGTDDFIFGTGGDGVRCTGDGILENRLIPNGKAECRFQTGDIDGEVKKIEIIPVIISEDEELGCLERISTWSK